MAEVEALRKKVAELESELSSLKVSQGKSSQSGRDYSTQKYTPKNPLGMKDYMPHEMMIREQVFEKLTEVFKRHGAVRIETPVMELKAALTGKYGEDTKLIYDLANQGGEILAMRYDLTVPFARFCAQHSIQNIKRYHIARVYRRDRPVIAKGRFREFYQCDFDIAGTYEPLVPDAECVKIVSEILSGFQIKEFVIKVNNRKILDGIFQVCGVDEKLLRPICSAVDKLDKLEWPEVRKEMIEKGITGEAADKIWSYVQHKGGLSLVRQLKEDPELKANTTVWDGLEETEKLLTYCKAFGVPDEHISFDLSLARGLDYYTGTIYEAIILGSQTGSVAGGGRYDGLVGMFNKKGKIVPCVGVSIGIERLFVIVEKMQEGKKLRKSTTEVLVASVAPRKENRQPLLEERLKILSELWKVGIHSETLQKLNPKALSQFQYCQDEGIPYAVVIGPDEVLNNNVKIRDVASREETVVSRSDMIQKLQDYLNPQTSK